MLLLMKNDTQRQATISHLVEENQNLHCKLKGFEEKLQTIATLNERTDVLASQVEEVIETIQSHARLTKMLEENISSLTPVRVDEPRDKTLALDDIERRLWLLENGSTNGAYLWKIDELPRRMREAKAGKNSSLVSAPFTVGRFGYKLFMTVYPNGRGDSWGTHLSIFATIVQSDFDQVLPWPFRNRVEIRLISKCKTKDIIKTVTPNIGTSFQRPTSQTNPSFGFPMFCPLTQLERDYVHRDAIYILADVIGLPDASPSHVSRNK